MTDASGELIQFLESELSERAIAYRALDDGRYELAIDSRQLIIGLDNLSRQYAKDQDEQVISDFVDSIVGSLQPIPEWKEARHKVFTLLETTDLEIDDQVIHRELSRLAQIIPVYYDEKSGSIKFITVSQVDAWGINHEQLWQAADSALDGIMQKNRGQLSRYRGLPAGHDRRGGSVQGFSDSRTVPTQQG